MLGWVVLLEKVACTLGFVELSAGLARSFFEKQEEFSEVASAFKPADQRFEDQYRDRIADLKDGNLIELILLDLVEAEASLRKQLSQRVFALSLPNAEAGFPRQLEIPLQRASTASNHPSEGLPSPVKVAICEHLQVVGSWPNLKAVVSLYESSHLDYGIARCEECRQANLTCFWELVDFEGGKDMMWTTRMSLSEEEVTELERLHRESRQAKDYVVRIGNYFENARDKIVWHPDGRYESSAVCPMQIAARLADEVP